LKEKLKIIIIFYILTNTLFASLDITDLYLRKIKGVEFTFSGNNGWNLNTRNKFEFFYETDYLMDAGTNNPKLITINNNEDEDKDPLAISDWGFFVDITSKKNPLDIIFFNFNSKTMMVNPDHSNYYLSTIALVFPEVVAYENSYIRQSITGFSISYNQCFNISYGFILNERSGDNRYKGFYELNVPFFYNSFVKNIENNSIERYEGVLHYDRFNFKLGFRYKDSISSIKHYYLQSNIFQNDGYYINIGAVLNGNFDIASAHSSFVMHSSKDLDSKNKFGYAYFITTSLFLTNPQRNNIWGSDFGDNQLYKGGKLEFSFQAPLLAWGGFFFTVFVGPFTLFDEDGNAAEAVLKASAAMIESSDESDRYFGVFTIGADYNNPELLREIPNAVEHWHIYLKFRIIY
jgi:hypothetical protein